MFETKFVGLQANEDGEQPSAISVVTILLIPASLPFPSDQTLTSECS